VVTAGGASAQLNIVTNLPGTFTDISGTGTPLSLADDASAAINTTVGNALLPAGSVAVGWRRTLPRLQHGPRLHQRGNSERRCLRG
jgi:hypothetical protein